MVKKIHLKITGVIFLLLMSSTVFILLLNINQTKSVTAQTYQTPTGTTTTINTACQSIPNVVGNTLCNLSNKVNQSSIPPVLSNACPNGGIPLNNICPVSVVPLQSNPINNTVTQISVPNVNTETIQIVPNISVTGNDGTTKILSADSFSIQLASFIGNTLSFISPNTQNIDISHGKVNVQIQIKARPNEVINANGTLWFSLNNVAVHPVGIFWSAIGTTDDNGLLTAKMTSPNGIINTYVYDINGISSLQTIPAKNSLNFTLSNLIIQNQLGQSYKNTSMQKFYFLELDYDQNMIIQKDSTGNYIKVYPNDDTFTISSTPTGITSYIQVPKQGTYQIITYPNPLPAGSASVYSVNLNGNTILLGSTGDITGYANNGSTYNGYSNKDTAIVNPASQTISNIPRDSDIEIVVTGGSTPFTKTIHTPTTHDDITFICDQTSCKFTS